MGSKYSFYILAAFSLTASANEPNSFRFITDVASAITGGSVPSTVIQENSRTQSNSGKNSHGGDYKVANKASPEDPTGFSPTNSGGGGGTNISYTFGSPTGSGSGGPKNINIELPFPGANSDSVGASTSSGASRALANNTASAGVGATGVGTGISSPQSGSSVASGAQAVSNGISNYGAQSAQGANTQTTSQNSGSQTPTFETLFRPGSNNLPEVSTPLTYISGSFETNLGNAGVTTNIPTNIGNLVGNSSNLFASILPGDSSGGSSKTKTKDTFEDSVQSAPPSNTYSTPLIIASNSPSQEAPVPTTSTISPTSTTPSSSTSAPSSTASTSTPSSTSSTTSSTPPSTAGTTTTASSAAAPTATSTPAGTTHSGGATAPVAPTTGAPIVTASNSTTPAPEATTSGANLSSTGGAGTAVPETQSSPASGLRVFDPSLPNGINKISLNSNDFQFNKMNGGSAVSNGDTVKTCIDKLNSYINSSTFTRSVDPTRNTVLNCVDSSSFNYLKNQSNFYNKLEEYYNKECSSLIKEPEYIAVIKLDPQSATSNYYEKLKEYKNKKYPNSESGQLYINRCANIYRLLDKYNKFKEIEETYTNEDPKVKNPVVPHSTGSTPQSSDD